MNEKKINIATAVYALVCAVIALIIGGPKYALAVIGISAVCWPIGRVIGRTVVTKFFKINPPAPLTQRGRW